MFDFRPSKALASPRRLGAGITDFAAGLTSGVAKNIVTEAEPAVRRVVRDERNRFAEAVIGAIPFWALSAMAVVGTRYLVPDDSPRGKAVGYGAAGVGALAGAWWTMSHLTDTTLSPPLPAVTSSGKLDPVIQQAAQTIVAEAEPKVRAIVEEEKARAVQAAKSAIPFAVIAAAAFAGTMFLVDDDRKGTKVLGYSAVAALLGAGAWYALDKERDVAAA